MPNILYIDEINLLDDHIVDLLLDAAAMGVNFVEREGVSYVHPSRFILVGTMNPEEGDLRPQLLDRFGLSVDIDTIRDVDQRVEVVERRERYEANPAEFVAQHRDEEAALTRRVMTAKAALPSIEISRAILALIARINIALKTDGHRGDLVVRKTAQALAAFLGKREVGEPEVYRAADLALGHRLKHAPLEQRRGVRRDLLEAGFDIPESCIGST